MDTTANAIHRARVCAILISAAVALSMPASADVLKLQDSPAQVLELAAQPERGVTQQQVRARFGEPDTRVPAVGEPPISRWDYDDFSVYFENDRVLHAVVNTDTAQAR